MSARPRKKKNNNNNSNLVLNNITALTDRQLQAFDIYDEEKHLAMLGSAGTGKTLIALFMALESILVDKTHRKLMILRSSVSSRSLGFLPGSVDEKMAEYEPPYRSIVNDLLFSRGDAYDILKKTNKIEFVSTSFLRGQTFDDCIIFLDEGQNCLFQEIDTVFTRVGKNCRLIVCGDSNQDDLTSKRYNEQSGLVSAINLLESINQIGIVHFQPEDIVRSGFVKQWILAKYNMER